MAGWPDSRRPMKPLPGSGGAITNTCSEWSTSVDGTGCVRRTSLCSRFSTSLPAHTVPLVPCMLRSSSRRFLAYVPGTFACLRPTARLASFPTCLAVTEAAAAQGPSLPAAGLVLLWDLFVWGPVEASIFTMTAGEENFLVRRAMGHRADKAVVLALATKLHSSGRLSLDI